MALKFQTSPVSVTVASSPVNGSNFVIVDGTPQITPFTNSTWFPGELHTLISNSPVAGGSGKQYIFQSWSAPSSGSSTSSTYTYAVPFSGETVTANYKTQYQLTVASTHDSPSPISGSWFDANSQVTESVTTPADIVGGTQYRCTGWSGGSRYSSYRH